MEDTNNNIKQKHAHNKNKIVDKMTVHGAGDGRIAEKNCKSFSY